MDRQLLIEELKNALAHLNDVAMLADSTLAQLLPASANGVEAASRGVQLRNLLTELVDGLKPSPDVAESAPEWRQYLILHDRYVLRKPLWEIEHKLTIGERQVRREHSRGLAILAEMLHARLAAGPASDAISVEPAATPQEAIQRLTPVSRVFGLAQLVEEVIAFLTVAGKMQEPQVQVHVSPDDLTVYTDPGILRQLLTRLLLSLLPALSPGGTLSFEASATDSAVRVAVRLAALGDPINLQDEALRLCRMLAGALGTELELHDDGTSQLVVFHLPPGSRLRKVLVIDDELAAVELFQSYVIGLDYQVIGETNAEAAVGRALEVQPDAVLLDVMMPAMDGWELLQRLRHTPQMRDVPVIVCSVLDEGDLASALGAAAFLKKPILRAQLVKTLDRVTQ
jgi:CheY-like chemotaxis protein